MHGCLKVKLQDHTLLSVLFRLKNKKAAPVYEAASDLLKKLLHKSF